MPTRRGALALLAAGLPAAAPAPLPPAPFPGPVPVRVVSYNIHAGADADGVFDLDRQAAALHALRADVIGLQEVDVRWGARSRWLDVAGELGRRLGMRASFAPVYRIGGRAFGVAVLSRFRVLAFANHRITRLSTQDPGRGPAPAPGFGEVVLEAGGVRLRVYVTHLDHRADSSVRAVQVAETRQIMRRAPGPKVLLGDLNAPPSAPELAPLWRELTDSEPGAFTFPARHPVKRIDYVAVSAGVRVHAAVVAGTLASDHRPVVADLRLER
ncbi:endonuclease/exonuclease/phosphatase family protein [Streptomyces sp. NBC_00162]|uniref:endonuclease/exonuclease/phosphatase family protein n=1 Tax=Streptomyces sp. NBC_00162 TaxID=2903629 RepID=UPI00214B0128|nr:endonuclease/exonuclease/phosphatase family protein [Streptomyces sp. NBC_00162]UUU44855.1 endonuclease/exonuclease/phosphatase family protein [Streptomyces sp. NBC_00162]